jgi:hypothetical protein
LAGDFVTIEVTGLDEAIDRMNNAAETMNDRIHIKLEQVCQDIVEYARSIAPRRTGAYAESIDYTVLGPCHFAIGAGVEYAAIIEFGSAAHFILPRTAKVLRFEIDGEVVFAKYVHHPGTAPQLIIHQAKLANYDKILQAVREGVEDAFNQR